MIYVGKMYNLGCSSETKTSGESIRNSICNQFSQLTALSILLEIRTATGWGIAIIICIVFKKIYSREAVRNVSLKCCMSHRTASKQVVYPFTLRDTKKKIMVGLNLAAALFHPKRIQPLRFRYAKVEA